MASYSSLLLNQQCDWRAHPDFLSPVSPKTLKNHRVVRKCQRRSARLGYLYPN